MIRKVIPTALVLLFALVCAAALAIAFFRRPTPADFRQPSPELPVRLPRDGAAHFDTHTEWWYYTGFLSTPQQGEFGFELVFFKVYMPPAEKIWGVLPLRWVSNPHLFAQFAVSDPKRRRHVLFERAHPLRLLGARAREDRFHVEVGDWKAWGSGAGHHLRVDRDPFGLHLDLSAAKPPVLHGPNRAGVVPMGRGGPSYYYSYSDLRGEGRLRFQDRVHDLRAAVWMDHQWGSWQPEGAFAGWDWFGLRFDNGSEAMLFEFRDPRGGAQPQSFGTWIFPDGSWAHLERGDYSVSVEKQWTSAKTKTAYPIKWTVSIPARSVRVTVEAAFPEQEMDLKVDKDYWEGMVTVEGTMSGKGYVELAGYAPDR